MLKSSARSLARGMIIDVVGIRIRVVGIVIAREAILLLMGVGANCGAGKAFRVGLNQAPELWMNWES